MTHVSECSSTRGLRVRLELPSSQLHRGEPLTGVARLESMTTKAITLIEISVHLATFGEVESATVRVLDETLVERDSLPALASRDFAFSVPLTQNATLGRGRVSLSVPYGSIWFAPPSLDVLVSPERKVAAFAELAAEIARHQIADWRVDGDGLVAELRPTLRVEHELHGIRIALCSEESEVHGTMTVTGRGPGLLRAFPGTSRVHPFRFRYSELEAARREFEAILFPYVSDIRDMPLPSQSGIGAEGLLLPAGENYDL